MFIERGIKPSVVNFADSYYMFPTTKWVGGVFLDAWKETMRLIGLKPADYVPQAHDCDDYAMLCSAYCRMLHRKTAERTVDQSTVAFGEFWYQSQLGKHALNVFVNRDGLGFFEPQSDSGIIKLTNEEIASCSFCRI